VHKTTRSPNAGDGLGHGIRQQDLRLVVVVDGRLPLGHRPEDVLVQHGRVVQTAEVRCRWDFLVAIVADAVGERIVGAICRNTMVIQVGEIELLVLKKRPISSDGGHLFRLDGDDGVSDGWPAAICSTDLRERDSHRGRSDRHAFCHKYIRRRARRRGRDR